MQMKFIKTPLPGAYEIQFEPYIDERGLFFRTYCQDEFTAIGLNMQILQMNHSLTIKKGTIRGLHCQYPPSAEIKIIRCVSGEVFDVIVDLRVNSPTFLNWHAAILTKENMRSIYVPEGFAHGFQALTDNVELVYCHSEFYRPEFEHGLRFDDPVIKIKWPLEMSAISIKDLSYSFIGKKFEGIRI
jgi:dTDP-4-dehydrorhamnose 3,5-epimerase